jgi:hypothetical protein
MFTSRTMSLTMCNPIASLNNHELRLALAREVMGWTNLREESDGRIVGDHPDALTTVPLTAPNWLENVAQLEYLESVVVRQVGRDVYRREVGRVAGDFNPHPTPRQRCEAVLSATRAARDAMID